MKAQKYLYRCGSAAGLDTSLITSYGSEYHKPVGINTPPQSEAHFRFKLGLM